MRRGFRSEPQIGVIFSLSLSLSFSLFCYDKRGRRDVARSILENYAVILTRELSLNFRASSTVDTWQLSTVLGCIDEIHIVRILLLNGRFYLLNGVYPDDKQESRVYKCVSKYDPC